MPVTMTRGAFALPGTSLAFKTGTWRNTRPIHTHAAAPCHGACPAGEDQQEWLARLQEGRPREAWEALVAMNPMPAVTGRVCPHPCESACNRGQYDSPIAIHGIERWLGDEAIRHNWAYPLLDVPVRSQRVAVVGAGPAGLSAAYHLLRRRYNVVLFDAMPEAGGLLRSAIPPTRLPRDVVDKELGRILALGIEFRPRTALGRDVSLDQLRSEFDAVFLGVGAGKSRHWDVDGAVPADLHEGLGMLKEWLVVGALPTPNAVVIHGGGNTAVDLARVMRRAGVKDVHVVTASGLPGPDTEPDDVLNVVPRELEQAVEEGVVFHPHRTINRLIMRGSKVVGVEMVRLKKLPDGRGRKSRVSFEGTETVLHVDMVVPAIGEVVDPTGMESVLHGKDYIKTDRFGRIDGQAGLFAGGDARDWLKGLTGGTVSAAIGDGRRAAEAIDALLSGREAVEPVRPPIRYDRLNLAYYENRPRIPLPTLELEKRNDTDEIEGGPSGAQALAEANRCFSCGNCLACDNCWTLCPDNAVVKTTELASDGSHYVFDYDYCKGCGLCAKECPCGYIDMVPDE
ncbi:FAD-dependent oxidoreductase [Magnetospirillum sp. UT-4]|uniref:FAD-dependent oxidoreductase n=1 Tax=Magnetospirillum sp. UT-4 TaxID=2681467 RepID=UPI00137C418E|nr:FAD-dependent oxidoreductase [Magnetospirillum sp. UT-4]CAA7618080.1 NADPH-dependent glutamate synthase beta chain and related oxidoreductases [Magnetospirillum sp. UT-4]